VKAFDWNTATVDERLAEVARRDRNRKAGRAVTDDGVGCASPGSVVQVEALVHRPVTRRVDELKMPEPEIALTRVLKILEAWSPDARVYETLVIHGQPPSKARPRFAKGAVYSSRGQRDAERYTKRTLAAAFERPLLGNVAVVCGFYRSNYQRVDVDNMLKHVMDAANGTVWEDDMQVTAMSGYLELDTEHPRTVIGIASYESSLSRFAIPLRKCERCDAEFQPQFHGSKQRYCGRECAAKGAGLRRRAKAPCRTCGTVFVREHALQRYCSDACGAGKNKKLKPLFGEKCTDCGTSRIKPGRCRRCWKKSTVLPLPSPEK